MDKRCILSSMQVPDQDQRSTRAEGRTIAHCYERAGDKVNVKDDFHLSKLYFQQSFPSIDLSWPDPNLILDLISTDLNVRLKHSSELSIFGKELFTFFGCHT